MGAILRKVFAHMQCVQTTIGDTPITVAFRTPSSCTATPAERGNKPAALLLYALLGGQALALNLFAPTDIALWQDAANSLSDEEEHGEAMSRAEAIADRRRDQALCDTHAGVDL